MFISAKLILTNRELSQVHDFYVDILLRKKLMLGSLKDIHANSKLSGLQIIPIQYCRYETYQAELYH